jgi:phosphate transport system permease protein
MLWIVVLLIIAAGLIAYALGRGRALASVDGNVRALNSLPVHYGNFTAIWAAFPALLLIALWALSGQAILDWLLLRDLGQTVAGLDALRLEAFLRDIHTLSAGGRVAAASEGIVAAAAQYGRYQIIGILVVAIVAIGVSVLGGRHALSQITPRLRARNHVEGFLHAVLLACSAVAVFTTIGIVLSLIFESLRFFQSVPIQEFLFGLHWSPQLALRADQTGGSGGFGAVPLFAGTLLITLIAMLVAAPVGLLSAVYLADYASARFRAIGKPLLEVLAGIPTVVYGFFAALTVAPLFRGAGDAIGLDVASESALAAGVVMGIMIIPFVSSLSDDVINAVPQSLRDGSAALGATRSETIIKVVLPAALPGIVSAMLLAVSRAVGETMIVVMAAGLAANLTANPLEAVTTVTVQIATLLVGDQEFDSPKTLAAFALGLVLFCITLALNVVALKVVQRYREQYD